MTDDIDPDAILAEALGIVEALSIAQVGDHGSMADLEAMAFHDRLEDPNLSFAVVRVFAGLVAAFAGYIAAARTGTSKGAEYERVARDLIRRSTSGLAFRAERRPPNDLPPGL